MPSLPDWISQRLKKISQEEFTNLESHRLLPPKKNVSLVHEYYSVPLAAGCGTAILTSPNIDEAHSKSYGSLVIVFHAFGQDCTSPFWHWIYEFAQNGVSVLSVDWDGHGKGSSSLLDIQEATRSIPLIIQRLYGEESGSGLNEKREGPRCFLMGYSFGASLALLAVTREDVSKHIAGVIAISPAIRVQSSFKIASEFFSFFNPFAWFSDFANKLGLYGLWGLFPAFGTFKRKHFPIRLKVDINYIEQAREFSQEIFLNRRILQKVKTPVLWVHGLQDRVSPYYLVCHLMLEIRTALFSFCDRDRGHVRMIFSEQVLSSTIKFIKNNIQHYNANKV